MLSVALKNKLALVLLLFVSNLLFAQKKSDQLQAEQTRLENKLNTTKGLLEKVKKGTQLSMNELKLIENQVRDREPSEAAPGKIGSYESTISCDVALRLQASE